MRKLHIDTREWFPRIWDVLGILLLFFVITFLVVVPAGIIIAIKEYMHQPGKEFDLKNFMGSEIMGISLTYGYIIPMALTVLLTILLAKIRPRFNFRPVYLHLFPLVLAGGFFLLLVEEGILELMPSPDDEFKFMVELIRQHPKLAFLTIAVAAPFLEEMLFRGIILKFLLKKYPPRTAIIFSALIFGAYHLNPWQFVGATLIGLYLGYIYWRTGSLFYPVLLHFLNNAFSFYLTWKTQSVEAGLVPEDKPWALPLIMFTGLMGLTSVMIFLEKYFTRHGRKTYYLASANPHKMEELRALMPPGVELRSLTDLRHRTPLSETGTTLEENSLEKAMQLARRYGVDVIADDTGLEVEALGGRPGVYSARFAGPDAGDADNRRKLLARLEGHENRKARFRTVITLSDGHEWYQFEGVAPGEIIPNEQGSNGFGYDPVFRPEGSDKTFAQMTAEEKNRISHRAKATRKLLDFLENHARKPL